METTKHKHKSLSDKLDELYADWICEECAEECRDFDDLYERKKEEFSEWVEENL